MNPNPTADIERQTFLDLTAAVAYLTKRHRYGLTITEAIEEAVRHYIAHELAPHWGDLQNPDHDDAPWLDDPDPLRTALGRLAITTPPPGAPAGRTLNTALWSAISAWNNTMANTYNNSQPWPHPAPIAGWPTLNTTQLDNAINDQQP